MKAQFEIAGLGITVKATFIGDKPADWGNGTVNTNYHVISVSNGGHGTGKGPCTGTITFDFWASMARPVLSTKRDLLDALECFVSDVQCGSGTFEDFCGDLGYDPDSRKALKVYKSCKKAAAKLEKLVGAELVEDFCNQVRDLTNA